MMKLVTILLVLMWCTTATSQTITLNPTDPLPPCMPITLGSTVNFERGIDCTADVVLLDINDIEVFRSSDPTFSYTFSDQGQFTFYCGAGTGAIAMAAICVEIGNVPTMSEWGVICLSLIMLIGAVVTIRSRKLTFS